MLRASRHLLAVVVAAAGAALAAPGLATAATWCGNDAPVTNRLPEYVAGNQIHVLYAFPADGADRFSELASPIVTDLEVVDTWWRGQDPTRTLRFDLFAFPGCGPGLPRLDLTKVRLPRPAAAYGEDPVAVFQGVTGDIAASPFGQPLAYAKYLVYWDGALPFDDVCGVSQTPSAVTAARTTAIVFLRSCVDDVGTGGYTAWTAAHELVHSLGAVQGGGPGTCSGGGHTCDHDGDLMGRFVNAPLSSAILDLNRDDYYGHAGSWLDVQDSPWLYRLGVPRPVLDVRLAGAGPRSTVQTSLPGIACPPLCRNDWDPGTAVRLTAVAGPGRRLVRWEGACTGRGACSLSLDADATATAVFGPATYRLALAISGAGTIRSSAGRTCAGRCSSVVAATAAVSLRAQPRRGYRFVRWSGACRGNRPTCTVRMTQARSVRAHFVRR